MRCGVWIVERRKARCQLSPETNNTKLWAAVLPSWGSGGGYITPPPWRPTELSWYWLYCCGVMVAAAVVDFHLTAVAGTVNTAEIARSVTCKYQMVGRPHIVMQI